MTFAEQAETFMNQVGTRKRNPVKAATLTAYRSLLNKWLVPILGNLPLDKIQNGAVKPLVDVLSREGMSASSINSIVGLVKAVVKNAIDENGNEIYPRTWNNSFMDVPTVDHAAQTAPIATSEAIQKAVQTAKGQFKGLIALLAGSGARIGEALALRVGPDNGQDSYWVPENGVLIIRSTVSKGHIQYAPKTVAGKREVDLYPGLNTALQSMLGVQDSSVDRLLFQDKNGGLLLSNAPALYKALKAASIPGFHSLRRFRLTHLDKCNTPEGLRRFWAGHAALGVSERYVKIGGDVAARRQWCNSVGIGFELEGV